nr:MAG TPA: hypothetical protein [Caudoviricetes sp.]
MPGLRRSLLSGLMHIDNLYISVLAYIWRFNGF